MTSYILLMIMGGAVCFIIFSVNNKYKKLKQTGVKTEGTLAGYEMVKIKNTNTKVPVASFTTKDNRKIKQKTVESFFPANARMGTKIIVFYNPENPQEFMIQGKKFYTMYLAVLILSIIFFLSGLFFSLNYLGILYFLKLK